MKIFERFRSLTSKINWGKDQWGVFSPLEIQFFEISECSS